MICKIVSRRSVVFAFCSFLLLCNAAAPTTLAHMSIEKLTQASRLIIRARCVENSSAWDAAEIWTFSTFQPSEIWKGSSRQRVSVRLLGGRVGNLTSNVSGIPRFHAGEEAVLFLAPTARGDFSVVSWVQGTFRIHRDPRSGAETVTQDSASFDTFDPSTKKFTPSGIRDLPLNEFRAQVAAAAPQEPGAQK
jgi:hypothetical protein